MPQQISARGAGGEEDYPRVIGQDRCELSALSVRDMTIFRENDPFVRCCKRNPRDIAILGPGIGVRIVLGMSLARDPSFSKNIGEDTSSQRAINKVSVSDLRSRRFEEDGILDILALDPVVISN